MAKMDSQIWVIPVRIFVGWKGERHASKCIDLRNGDEVGDIMTRFGLTDEEKREYDVDKNKFEGQFVVPRKAINE